MKQTVIGEIYYSFTQKELKQLDKYLRSSAWRESDTIINCHECFYNFTSKSKLEKLDKEFLYQYVYPGTSFNDSKLRFSLNRLLKAIKEYQIVTEFEKENIFTQKIWMDFLTEKKLKKNIQYNLESEDYQTHSEYKYIFQYFKSQESSFQHFNFSKDIQIQYQSIIEVMKRAEVFSDLVFIKNYCALITFSSIYQSLPSPLPLDKLHEIIEKHWEREFPEFDVFVKLVNLLTHKRLEDYQAYKLSFFESIQIWNDAEIINLIAYLLNFTTIQINKGDSRFIDEQFQLFQIFEEKGFFKIPNYINQGRINNVIHIYLRKKEYQKAERFVHEYTSYLAENQQDSCKHFNIARIKYETKSYKDSLRELLQVDFSQDTSYSINSKYLLLKNYFELKESDALDSLCTSFKEYIRKNKVITENYKNSTLNFIKMLNKIYGSTQSNLLKIKTEIETNAQIAEKNWLLEKIEEKLNG